MQKRGASAKILEIPAATSSSVPFRLQTNNESDRVYFHLLLLRCLQFWDGAFVQGHLNAVLFGVPISEFGLQAGYHAGGCRLIKTVQRLGNFTAAMQSTLCI